MRTLSLAGTAREVQGHLNVLCRDIGTRLAASENETRAAEYIAGAMRRIGLSNVSQPRFPFEEWGFDVCELRVRDGAWRAVKCLPVNSPSTPAKGIEAEVVYVDSATPAAMKGLDVKGKILLVWGTYGETTERLEYLAKLRPAAVMWLDDRLPFDWPAAVGTPYDWRDILPIPQVSIPYVEAWRLARGKKVRARLKMKTWRRAADSVNVFGDIPGTGDEFVHIGGHIDTVIVGTGADDDASGVVATLEAARCLLGRGARPCAPTRRPRRTIRFVCYGGEEQLSEGSRRYVLANRKAAERTRLCINLDAVGSIAGRNEARVVGPKRLTQAVKRIEGYPCEVKEEVSPYSDMFAFNIFGAPSVWFYRVNMPTGRFFHHCEHDDLAVVSAAEIARAAGATARLAYQAAYAEPSWRRTIPKPQADQIRMYAKRFFGL